MIVTMYISVSPGEAPEDSGTTLRRPGSFVITFNCSSSCSLYKYYDKTSESVLSLNTADQIEDNCRVHPQVSERKTLQTGGALQQSASQRQCTRPHKGLPFPLYESICTILSHKRQTVILSDSGRQARRGRRSRKRNRQVTLIETKDDAGKENKLLPS